MANKPKVIITLDGGLIQEIIASEDIIVEVQDEDTDGADEEDLTKNHSGKLCFLSHWEVDAAPKAVEENWIGEE